MNERVKVFGAELLSEYKAYIYLNHAGGAVAWGYVSHSGKSIGLICFSWTSYSREHMIGQFCPAASISRFDLDTQSITFEKEFFSKINLT